MRTNEDNFISADKQGPVLSRQICQLYQSVDNPFTFALRLYANCRDTTSTKNTSLAFSRKFGEHIL